MNQHSLKHSGALKGRTILLTGAAGHLGRAMAFGLAAAGAHVLVNSRTAGRANEVVRQMTAGGLSAETCVFDVSDDLQIKSAIAALNGRALHGLINNAYAGEAGTIEVAQAQQYRDSYELAVVAAHNLLQAALPSLRLGVIQSGDASVINIASMYGLVSPDLRVYGSPGSSNPPFYGAAKAALIQWTRYAGCEFGPEGIRVNSISPGPFPADTAQKKSPDFVDALAARVPLGRVGRADEIVGPVVFLASSAASYVNCSNLVVDGGWTAW